jgi:ribosome-associated protein
VEGELASDVLARLVFDAMADRHAADVAILDIRPVSLISDFFVIGTAESQRQLRAVVEAVIDAVRDAGGGKPIHQEGEAASGWVLVDFGPVVAHVFDPDRRAFYDLESMWSEAPLVARMP